MEDLNTTKQKINQMASQGKSAEEIKNTITLLSDDEEEEQKASEYAADKLQESLLETTQSATLGHLFQNPGLTLK